MKKHFAAFLLALAAGSASASTYTTDYTDLWYVPSESGWGLNLIHQEDVIFGTLFVYGPDNTPHWYVASDMRYQGSGGPITYTGVLYETSGTWLGTPGFRQLGMIGELLERNRHGIEPGQPFGFERVDRLAVGRSNLRTQVDVVGFSVKLHKESNLISVDEIPHERSRNPVGR